MKVWEVMTSNPLTISPTYTICEAVGIFIENKIDVVPVLDDTKKLVGLFTKRHVYRAVYKGVDMNTKVNVFMTQKIITARPEDKLEDVVNIGIACLPVINEKGQVVGVVTPDDILKALYTFYTGIYRKTDTMISAPHNEVKHGKQQGKFKAKNGKNNKDMFGNLVVSSAKMKQLLDTVVRLASVDSTILITGESGTGKELIAQIIHRNNSRHNKPFIRVNCGAIPENLLESELFGYDGGAFTGAKKEGKSGYIELASQGTLFLDEIGDMPLNLQVKVLRFLQNKEIIRIGGSRVIDVDVRIVAATNRDLLEMVHEKQFREDLYYRLNVVPVHIPPLRERKEDIPPLIEHFLEVFNVKYQKKKRMMQETVDKLMRYNWPGNIRELENLIERMVVTISEDNITVEDLPAFLREATGNNSRNVIVREIVPLREAVESAEKQLLEKAYANYRTARQMAKILKVDPSTIVRKAAKYGIIRPY